MGMLIWAFDNWALMRENPSSGFEKMSGSNLSAQLQRRAKIRYFSYSEFRYHFAWSEKQRLWSDCTVVQASLHLCCLHTTNPGFLTSRPNCMCLQMFSHVWFVLMKYCPYFSYMFGTFGNTPRNSAKSAYQKHSLTLKGSIIATIIVKLCDFFIIFTENKVLSLCLLGNFKFSCFFCRLLIFFQNQLFQKILLGIRPESQIVWIQIRPDVLSGLIWVLTICKRYQQTKLEEKEWTGVVVYSY